MQPPVKIQKEGNHINVSFSYNEDLVDIMREQGGWYRYKQMSWMFPASRKSEIIDVLKEHLYRVTLLPDANKKVKEVKQDSVSDRFKNQDIVSVWGLCKVCNQKKFVGKDCICGQCRMEKS